MTEAGLDSDRDTSSSLRPGSYRRLADVFHYVLSEQNLEALLEKIAEALADLVPYDTLSVYQADEAEGSLEPVLAKDKYAEQILNSKGAFGRGITGWAVEHRRPILANDAHLDPRAEILPGTPADEESMISIPLISRGAIMGALNIYRIGEGAAFTEEEFELAKRFGDAAALALDNAEVRASLEFQALTDSLTGLYNHRHFHERLRAELQRANRARDTVALMMLDLDDFKRINDVYGHGVGDQVLVTVADEVRATIRGSDVACRLGGEEFAVIMPSCNAGDAFGLASRLSDRLSAANLDPAPKITVSIGIAQGPDHAMNPRELVACAEAAMTTAKSRGKNRTVLFEDTDSDRSETMHTVRRDIRSIAHLKMLQSLAGKLNRLNSVNEIGEAITSELRTLIDYHNCRVYVADGELLIPVAFRGEVDYYAEESREVLTSRFGEGITGVAAATGQSLLIPNAVECEYAVTIPGTDDVDESMIAVPLRYGSDVVGVIVVSKLGIDQFDEEDVRLIEVLCGQASVAIENARLYDSQRRDAQNARALLESADVMAAAGSFNDIGDEAVRMSRALLGAPQAALWLESERSGEVSCVAHAGYVGDPSGEQMIRVKLSKKSAEGLLGENKTPFVAPPREIEKTLGLGANLAPHPIAVAPIHQGDGLRGALVVRQPLGSPDFFTEDRMRLLEGLAYQTSVAMQKAGLYRDQKESAEIASSLLNFGKELASTVELDEILSKSVELAARFIGSPRTSLWIEDRETGGLGVEAAWGYEGEQLSQLLEYRIPAEWIAEKFSGNDPFLVLRGDVKELRPLFEQSGNLSFAVAPLTLEGDRMACLMTAAPVLGNYEFSERKLRLLAGVANQAKIAIDRAMSFENLESTFLSTVEALANALEAKDEYTSSHTHSITELALEVGHRLGLDAKGIKKLHLGALFHDIGKIGIPSEILLKPGPLTDEERKVIETHPELGERILAPIERLRDVRPIVRHCHEHFDGSGYPDGKVGEKIPLESRIILVCDAYDAMTTDRPYRKRMTDADARARLEENAGTQFDPKIVEIFLQLLEENPAFAA